MFNRPTFRVTKRFTSGILSGLTIVDMTNVRFSVGFICAKSFAGDSYVVLSVEEVANS